MPKNTCVFCDRAMEEALPGSLDNYQPYYGGEVKFIFAYGSTKFDENMDNTVFRGLVCDDCGERFTEKMDKQN